MEDGIDDMPRLARAAAAKLGDAYVRSERGRYLLPLRPQNLVLGTRNVVLRQLADRRKQRRAERVIKVMREEELWRRGQPSAHILGEAAGGKREGAMQDETLARRTRRVDGERGFHGSRIVADAPRRRGAWQVICTVIRRSARGNDRWP